MGNYYWLLTKAVLQELVTVTVTYRVLIAVFTNWYISSCTTSFEFPLLEILNHNDLLNCH